MKREEEIIKKTIYILKKYLNSPRILLFGSRAKGNDDKHADFDFAVDSKRPQIFIERQINEEIDGISGLYKIDIVYMLSVDKKFREIIVKTGREVYEGRD